MRSSDFIIENGVLIKYKGKGGDVVIPDGVTSIGEAAFSNCDSLTSITIPDGVTSIGDYAFYWCSSLTSIMIPDGVTSIGKETFELCHALTNITIPNSVTRIGEAVFSNCDSLTSITIPDSVTSIGDRMFEDCGSLTSIVIPDSVTSIGNNAFEGCEDLTRIVIPDSVTSVGEEAFCRCRGLADSNGFVIVKNIVFSYFGAGGNIAIPKGVTGISNNAFNNTFHDYDSLTSIVIPDGVTSIGEKAFKGCKNLTSVVIPESVTSIGNGAFSGCEQLVDSNGFVIVKNTVFSYRGTGGNIAIPDGVTSIGEKAFEYCSNLTSITIPDSVTSIGVSAFEFCYNLANITTPDSMTSIGNRAFCGCSSLTNITIPNGVTSIGDWMFSNCSSLTNIVIPEDVTNIGGGAFSGCDSLTSIVIPDSVTSIGENTFANCKKLAYFEAKNADITFHAKAFGESLPLSAVASVFRYQNKLSDGDVKHYFLTEKAWSTLTDDQKGELFFTRQSKSLAAEYTHRIIAEEAQMLGNAALDKLAGNPGTKDCNAAAALMSMASGRMAADLLKKLYAALKQASNNKQALKTVEADNVLMSVLETSTADQEDLRTAEQYVIEALQAEGIRCVDIETSLKERYSLTLGTLPAIQNADGSNASPLVLAWLLQAHEKWSDNHREIIAAYEKPGIRPEAEKVVSLLDAESLQEALRELATTNLGLHGHSKKMYLAYPICRYAGRKLMEELTARAPKWRSSVSGNDAPPLRTFRQASAYNNERCAVLFAEKYGDLNHYASIRGTDADTLRDTVLIDFGLDTDGKKAYDLGNTTITATLQKDLSFGLYDEKAGKIVKSIPKKGNDPEKVAAASADFAEMKKNVKKVAKNRSDRLFETFLSGETTPAEKWSKTYSGNVLLRYVAELIVWEQNGRTFTLSDSGTICSDGTPYALTGDDVRIAHPIEMTADEVTAWQKYFTANSLKQPFAQVWERAIDPRSIREDRYSGCTVPINFFRGASKHGIEFYDEDFHDEIYFEISVPECDLQGGRTVLRRHELLPDDTFTLGKFTFKKYTRRVNHIVTVFDRWTVFDRVKKDDVSVADLLDIFTLAQIMEFISAAQEAKAVNVLALLMEYKNSHFADFDPMDEFVL